MNIYENKRRESFTGNKSLTMHQICNDTGLTGYTRNGITFTKMSFGGWLCNGTMTDYCDLPVGSCFVKTGHTYLFTGSNETLTAGFMRYNAGGCDITERNGEGSFSTATSISAVVSYRWFSSSGTFNYVMFFPQIFDLTEIYGKGNEPTTLEAFRKDFPNAYYPYTE